MSTNTILQLVELANDLREDNATILETLRQRSVDNLPIEQETVAGIGRLLDSIDTGLRSIITSATGAAGGAGGGDDETKPPVVPSADSLYATRRIVIAWCSRERKWFATREPHRPEGSSFTLPRLMLHEDGWDEWGKSREARFFPSEFEARAVAANTPIGGEPIQAFPERFAVIVIADEERDGLGISIATHFEPGTDPVVDLAEAQGSHRVALDALRSMGQPTPAQPRDWVPAMMARHGKDTVAPEAPVAADGACGGECGEEVGIGGGR